MDKEHGPVDEYDEEEVIDEEEAKDEFDELFGDEDEEENDADKKKHKKKDELDEIYEQSLGHPEEDIYATEDFERFDEDLED